MRSGVCRGVLQPTDEHPAGREPALTESLCWALHDQAGPEPHTTAAPHSEGIWWCMFIFHHVQSNLHWEIMHNITYGVSQENFGLDLFYSTPDPWEEIGMFLFPDDCNYSPCQTYQWHKNPGKEYSIISQICSLHMLVYTSYSLSCLQL